MHEPEEKTDKLSTLNEEQMKALDDFFSFMLSNDKYYHLTGPGGTGKTYTLARIMDEGMKRYEQACKLFNIPQTIFTFALTATTNKAAEVLSQAVGVPAQTIHSYMGFKVFVDYTTGQQKLSVKNPNMSPKYNELIIIDESSMIDFQLYTLLEKYTHNCKFLFVGDHCQMAPVQEKKSKIYEHDTYLSKLTTPMRQANNAPLLALAAQWRKTVETGQFYPMKEEPGVVDFLSGPQMQALVDKTFKEPDNNARILCYTNKQVKAYNKHIRMLRGLPDYFDQGEFLVSGSAYNAGDYSLSVEEEIEVTQNYYKESTIKLGDIEFNTYLIRIRKRNMEFDVKIPSDINHFNECKNYFKRKKDWVKYYHMQERYPDLRMRDASTVYKAQGSTYDTVFVDLTDISSCTHADQAARMMYVATTRPKKNIYFYGQLKKDYQHGSYKT